MLSVEGLVVRGKGTGEVVKQVKSDEGDVDAKYCWLLYQSVDPSGKQGTLESWKSKTSL